jgi:hypothetical protein
MLLALPNVGATVQLCTYSWRLVSPQTTALSPAASVTTSILMTRVENAGMFVFLIASFFLAIAIALSLKRTERKRRRRTVSVETTDFKLIDLDSPILQGTKHTAENENRDNIGHSGVHPKKMKIFVPSQITKETRVLIVHRNSLKD